MTRCSRSNHDLSRGFSISTTPPRSSCGTNVSREKRVAGIGKDLADHDAVSAGLFIGPNVTIDRGALGPTVIGKGTKIDNLVQIAHNVEIGEGALIISQVGISGSCKFGKYVILAGQVRFCRTFENRRSRDRLGAIGRDDRHSGWRKMAGLAGATRQAGQTPDDCHPAPAGPAQARRGAGKAGWRKAGTAWKIQTLKPAGRQKTC